jgi:hypothetical protein
MQERRLRAQPVGKTDRLRRVNAIRPGFIGTAGDYPTAKRIASHDDRTTFERRVEKPLDRDKKGIQVQMDDVLGIGAHIGTS